MYMFTVNCMLPNLVVTPFCRKEMAAESLNSFRIVCVPSCSLPCLLSHACDAMSATWSCIILGVRARGSVRRLHGSAVHWWLHRSMWRNHLRSVVWSFSFGIFLAMRSRGQSIGRSRSNDIRSSLDWFSSGSSSYAFIYAAVKSALNSRCFNVYRCYCVRLLYVISAFRVTNFRTVDLCVNLFASRKKTV